VKFIITSKENTKLFKLTVMVLDVVIVIALFSFIWLGINIVQMYLPKPGEIQYNCSIAEIHPDYTPAMRRACREQFEKEAK